ncbi:MAG: hypothetical protein M1827_000170 [Pycnora praestabilis]|nr:MAG: hypothetical protein M1827_000170 [Pycnora praestabilis]
MATTAHCLYCFETLASSFENRPSLSLPEVQVLWDQYESTQYENSQEEEWDGIEDADPVEEAEAEEALSSTLKPAGVNRLMALSPCSGSSSSTPSSISTTSSSAALGDSSNSSSSSSFFSPGPQAQQKPAAALEEHPLFVTWNTISRSGNKSLRGCIGTFMAQEVDSGIKSYALTSAFEDTRFPPITIKELPTLEASVTLLTTFEPAPTPTSWTLGTHGLRISFPYHSKRYSATYLPDVPVEQGWTKEETLNSLMRKAGWSGRKDDWRKVGDLKVVRYQGRRVGVGYREWREWRDWVDEMR